MTPNTSNSNSLTLVTRSGKRNGEPGEIIHETAPRIAQGGAQGHGSRPQAEADPGRPAYKKVQTPERCAFGTRVRARRERLGLTAAQLAAIIGITDNGVTQYETGRSIPLPQRLQTLAQELGVTTTWLLTGADMDQPGPMLTSIERSALDALRQMPKDRQQAALAALRGIALLPER